MHIISGNNFKIIRRKKGENMSQNIEENTNGKPKTIWGEYRMNNWGILVFVPNKKWYRKMGYKIPTKSKKMVGE